MSEQLPSLERFWKNVDKRGPDQCWHWLAHVTDSGHGKVRAGKKLLSAHRVSYALTNGPIPDNLLVRHTCDEPSCVNPAHLILGTVADNNADTRARAGRTKTGRPKNKVRFSFGEVWQRQPLKDRLLNNIIVMPDGCWRWIGTVTRNGKIVRGVIKLQGKLRYAHRVMYEELKGSVPAGMHLLHSCDNYLCVNPDHLRPGTHAENMADMKQRGRAAKGKDNHFGQVAYHGSKNGNAKLTEDAVREIRAGMTIKQAMERFGISEGNASKVIAGSVWKHVV